jgi:methionyl-tRNA synthetase
MSKSRGTVVRPLDLVPVYGLDAFRYFLLREMVFGLDANFSEEALVQRINADLANDLGNLFSRTLAMTGKYFAGNVPPFGSGEEVADAELRECTEEAARTTVQEVPKLGFHKALMSIWECINAANRYIDHVGPWNLAKDPDRQGRLQTVIRNVLEVNKIVAVLVAPFMPSTAQKMLERLGVGKSLGDLRLKEDASWGTLAEGTPVSKGEALFPRIELKDSKEMPREPREPKMEKETEKEPEAVTIDAFREIDLRVGTVLRAERIPKSGKLLRLIVDLGEERQIVAGIAQHYAPEDLLGKQVVVVANLQPAKLMGVESHGMVLAAHDGQTLRLVTTDRAVPPGGKVS